MIVPMKKIHVIVQKKDIVSALESLRESGSVHVEHEESLTGYQLEEQRQEVEILEQAIKILDTVKTEKDVDKQIASDGTKIVSTVLELSAEIDRYKENISKRQIQINHWKPWGNFDPKDIDAMAAEGVTIQLYAVPKDKKSNVPPGVIFKTIYSSGGIDRCVAISRGKIDCPFEKIALPLKSLNQMSHYQNEEQVKIEQAQKKIDNNLRYLESLEKTLVERRNVLNFEEVQKGMKEDEDLVVLKGFCPHDECKDLKAKTKEEQWALLIEDPNEGDQVPTYLRNPKWIELSKPVFSLVEILPGYKEFDVSMILLIFFSIFAGMLIGDAAYGMIYACLALLAQVKLGKRVADKRPFYLLYVLAGTTVVWGFLTGTFFGQQWLPQTVQPLVPWLNDYTNIQLLCFTIAIIHLSIARLWSAASRFPSTVALSDLGWLSILWGMYFMANYFVLNMALPPVTNFLLLVGAILALIFMVPLKDAVKTVPKEIIPFFLSFIGAFTDIVSYIRLFAVGLATVAVADATNAMAAQAPIAGKVVILFIGHSLNLILAAMAILVHGIRLNILEFSGHLHLEWTGFKYAPFRNLQKA